MKTRPRTETGCQVNPIDMEINVSGIPVMDSETLDATTNINTFARKTSVTLNSSACLCQVCVYFIFCRISIPVPIYLYNFAKFQPIITILSRTVMYHKRNLHEILDIDCLRSARTLRLVLSFDKKVLDLFAFDLSACRIEQIHCESKKTGPLFYGL